MDKTSETIHQAVTATLAKLDWRDKDYLNTRMGEHSWAQSGRADKRDTGDSHEEGNERDKRTARQYFKIKQETQDMITSGYLEIYFVL